MIDKSLFKLPGVRKVMMLLLVLSLAQAACVIGQAWSLASAIGNLWAGSGLASQMGFVALFFICFAGYQALIYIQDSYMDRFARTTARELRAGLLDVVFVSQTRASTRRGTADLAQTAIEGIDQIETYLRLILPKMVGMFAITVPVWVMVLAHHWVSAAVLAVMFPVIILFMVILGRQAKAMAEAQYGTYTVMSNHFIDTLRGISTLKAFGASREYGDTIYEVSEDFRRATVRTLRVATLNGAVMDLLTTIGVAAVAIMLGFGLMEGSVSLYVGLVCLILAPEYFKPIREFSSDFHASLDGKNALASVVGLLYEDASTYAEEQVAIPGWDEQSYLAFENVHFAYPADDAIDDDGAEDVQANRINLGPEVLENISFMARGYEKIGIVGISGSGKSTLVNLLGGFELPTGGSIDLDGVRLGSMRQQGWQNQVFYIPQDPYIFHASLRDNIMFYSPDASDADVERVIEVVGLGQLVVELPDGLDTLIGEGGRGLSGGQAQRIALARVLLDSSRKVLLFDEPTAHLDIETELELKQRMLGLMEGHLVIFATHRLHWLADMDRIFVIEDGSIVEQGTLDELLAVDGALVRLVSQMNRGCSA